MTQKLYPLIFWKFYSGCRFVGETPQIIDKMTNFWRLVFSSIIWLLATLCNTLIRIRENHWFLRLISRFSESVSEYESAFEICVWIIIHHLQKDLKHADNRKKSFCNQRRYFFHIYNCKIDGHHLGSKKLYINPKSTCFCWSFDFQENWQTKFRELWFWFIWRSILLRMPT